jgi:hypothetical protein
MLLKRKLHEPIISTYTIDGMAVTSLSANLQQKISTAMDRPCQIVLNRKLLCKLEKWCKFLSCIKAKSCKKNHMIGDLPVLKTTACWLADNLHSQYKLKEIMGYAVSTIPIQGHVYITHSPNAQHVRNTRSQPTHALTCSKLWVRFLMVSL